MGELSHIGIKYWVDQKFIRVFGEMLQEKPEGTFWPTQFREGVPELVSCRDVFQTKPVWAQSEGSQPLYYAVFTITAFSQLASEWSKAH